MKNQIKNYSLFIVTALLSMCFVNCQKESANVTNDKIVMSNTVSGVTQIRASIHATITSNGGNEITERGVCYDIVPNPTISSNKMIFDGVKTDTFTLRISNLKPNTKYYARAYATNSKGTGYGNEVNFTTTVIKIGDIFEGGHVIYVDATGLHGLIAALRGLDYDTTWGCKGVLISGTKTELGTGKANTSAITKVCRTPGIAARWTEELNRSSFDDWYLPSKDELTEMFKYVTDLNTATRWTSSEVDANSAWAVSFDAANKPVPVIMDKSTILGVRPIRAFNL